jgi:hypothetical protein
MLVLASVSHLDSAPDTPLERTREGQSTELKLPHARRSAQPLELTMSKNRLVVQLPMPSASEFDALVHIEDILIQAFEQNRYAVVDGHDAGQGRFNIFLFPTGAWGPVIDRVKAFLKLKGVLAQAAIAKRLKSERYVVVWPEDHVGGFEL